jgi:hypothetical protein
MGNEFIPDAPGRSRTGGRSCVDSGLDPDAWGASRRLAPHQFASGAGGGAGRRRQVLAQPPSRRAERVDAAAHPLAAEGRPVIFGDPDTRFADLVAILVDAAGRLRAASGEVV